MSEKLGKPIKFSGSSLFYALVISLLIAIISVAFISIAYYQRLLFDYDLIQEKLIRNANSGLNILLAQSQKEIPSYTLDLYDAGNDSIHIGKKKWGLFEVATSEAFQQTIKGRQSKQKVALIGSQPDSISKAALYITYNKEALSIAGNTKIKGTAYLSKKGIQSTIIDKEAFKGKKLIDGIEKRSISIFPKINRSLSEDIAAKYKQTVTTQINSLSDSITQSFLAPTLFVRANYLHIDHQLLKGNICLIADSAIYIGRNTIIEDILIYSPNIQIETGFVGSLQAFSSKKIEVGDYTTFHYPSVLSLFKAPRSLTAPTVNIGTNVTINGLILVWADDINKEVPLLAIKEKSVIRGRVFANAIMNLSGSIYGNITLYKFNLNVSGTAYDNHLYNVTIDATKRSNYYLDPFFQENRGKTAIAKWLN